MARTKRGIERFRDRDRTLASWWACMDITRAGRQVVGARAVVTKNENENQNRNEKEKEKRERGEREEERRTRRAHKSIGDIGATLASDSSIDRYLNEYSSAVRDPLFEIKAEGTTVHLDDVRRYSVPAGPWIQDFACHVIRGLSSRPVRFPARGYWKEKSRVPRRPRLSGTRTPTCSLSASVIHFDRRDRSISLTCPERHPSCSCPVATRLANQFPPRSYS